MDDPRAGDALAGDGDPGRSLVARGSSVIGRSATPAERVPRGAWPSVVGALERPPEARSPELPAAPPKVPGRRPSSEPLPFDGTTSLPESSSASVSLNPWRRPAAAAHSALRPPPPLRTSPPDGPAVGGRNLVAAGAAGDDDDAPDDDAGGDSAHVRATGPTASARRVDVDVDVDVEDDAGALVSPIAALNAAAFSAGVNALAYASIAWTVSDPPGAAAPAPAAAVTAAGARCGRGAFARGADVVAGAVRAAGGAADGVDRDARDEDEDEEDVAVPWLSLRLTAVSAGRSRRASALGPVIDPLAVRAARFAELGRPRRTTGARRTCWRRP